VESAADRAELGNERGSLTRLVGLLIAAMLAGAQARSQTPCSARESSLTPGAWRSPVTVGTAPPRSGLRLVREIPLPGPANRFDYQSFDPVSGRIYMNHMDAGRTIVFDANNGKVVAEIGDVPRATGVLAVPSHHQVYVSAPGNHEVAIIDDRTLKITSRIGGMGFPDGIAYASAADKVFVSDESGEADIVIDPNTARKRSTIDLGGEAGNTHYDSVSHCILVAVQTRNQLVAIDPVSEKIVARYGLPGSDGPHGFTVDEPDRLAFISSEGSGNLQVLDLRTMRIVQTLKVPDDPDVLAWDPSWRRLYVAAESGALSAFWLDGKTLRSLGQIRAPHAHTVSVGPRTHLVYLPLENVNGRPVLRIYQPVR
jgi:DNA-binding beta-propeller fold protein YncE